MQIFKNPALLSSAYRRLFVKRICILLSICAFWILAALTASLPLNSPSNQYKQGYAYLDPQYPDLDNGDTAWMIISTILGIVLSPLLAYFYGSIEGKSSSSLVYTCFVTAAAITMMWIMMGFSLCYGSDANGNQLLGNPLTYFMFTNVGAAPSSTLAPTIPLSIFALYELCFPLLSATIVACSVNGRINTIGWLLFICVWHILLFCPIMHLMWAPNGFIRNHYVRDFSGGSVVNMTGSMTALSINFIIGPNPKINAASGGAGVVVNTNSRVEPNAPNVLTSLTLVWLSWFALSAGKAHAANSIAAQTLVNSMASTSACVLMWILLDFIIHKRSTLVSIANAVLASLITMAPSAGYFTAGGAICASILSVLATYYFGFKVTRELTEPKQCLSVITLHGFTGTVGFFLTSIFSYTFINETGTNGLTYGNGLAVAFQISAILILIPIIILASGAIFYVVDSIVPIRSEEEYTRPGGGDIGNRGGGDLLMSSSSSSSSSGGESSSIGEESSNNSTVEMFDLFQIADFTHFNRSDAYTGDFGVSVSDNNNRPSQSHKDSSVRIPDRVSENSSKSEDNGFYNLADSMRLAFRNELQEFITTKVNARGIQKHSNNGQFETAI